MKRFLRRLYLAAITGAIVTLAAAQRLARPRSHPYRPHDVRRILVLRLGLLGDGTALLTPALRVLRESFPDAEVHVIATPLQRPLLEPLPFVDQVLTWSAGDLLEPRQAVRPGAWRAAFAAVRELRRQRYDLAVSCYGGLASAIALLSGARHRFGYAGEGLPATLSHTLPGRRYDRPWHEADYSVALAQAAAAGREPLALDIGGPAGFGPPLDLVVTPDARAAAAALLEAPLRPTIGPRPISTTGTRHMVALHPGATNGLAKRWPVAYWADVASRLVDDGATIVLVGGPETRRLADEIKTRSGRTIVDLVGKTSVLELLAVLERASVVVSGDSGPLHLAVALHCPTVGIFGPTDPRISGPYQAPNAVVVRHDLPCSPCYRLDRVADCPLGHTLCQRLITPNAVYHAVRATLEHVAGSR